MMSNPIYINQETLYKSFLEHPSVCTDSRKLKRGDLFVALKGPSFDGNDFALKSLELGAAYAVVSRPDLAEADPRCLLVKDTLEALQDLARSHRASLNIPVICITGTNGKTTTKELTCAVLSRKYRVLATEGNLNNHIGVPLTILKITSEHEVAIIEMGASAEGEIRLLSDIAQPTIGVITNIGKAHLQGFGSQKGILRAKSELFEYLEHSNGVYLLNGDDPLLRERWYHSDALTYGVGLIEGHNHFVRGMHLEEDPYLSLEVIAKGEHQKIGTNLIGKYNASNVLAAVAVGIKLGITMGDIAVAMKDYVPSNNRSQLVKMNRGIDIILDCYNANPSSMMAALQNIEGTKKIHKMVVLGDMLELGEESEKEHAQVINWLRQHPDIVPILVGHEFGKALNYDPAVEGERNTTLYFDQSDSLQEFLKNLEIPDESIILIKGSRGMALERCEPLIEASACRSGKGGASFWYNQSK